MRRILMSVNLNPSFSTLARMRGTLASRSLSVAVVAVRIRIVPMSTRKVLSAAAVIYFYSAFGGTNIEPEFRVIAFFTGKQDQAHISFLHEAERWFPEMAAKYNF